MKVGGIRTWKELTTGVQQVVRLLLTIILSTPDLSFKTVGFLGNFYEVFLKTKGFLLLLENARDF